MGGLFGLSLDLRVNIKFLFSVIFFAQFLINLNVLGAVKKSSFSFGLFNRISNIGSHLAINNTGEVGSFSQKSDTYFALGLEINSNHLGAFEDYFVSLNYLKNRFSRQDFEESTELSEHFFRLDIGKYFSNFHQVNISSFFGLSAHLQTMNSKGGTIILRNGNTSSEFDLPGGKQYQVIMPIHLGASIILVDYLRCSLIAEAIHLFSARKNYSLYGGLSFAY